jgi:hypothetical protein
LVDLETTKITDEIIGGVKSSESNSESDEFFMFPSRRISPQLH